MAGMVRRRKVWRYRKLLTEHAFDELRQLDCTFSEFELAMEHAEIIEEQDRGMASITELLLVVDWRLPLHLVVVVDDDRREERVVTVYLPDSKRWTPDYRRRR